MIGAGMVGAACALRLQAGGMAVKLVDPGDQRRGASFGNAGHIAVEQVSPWSSWENLRSFPSRLFGFGGALDFRWRDVGVWAPWSLEFISACGQERFRQGRQALTALLADALPAWTRLAALAERPDILRPNGHRVVWMTHAGAEKGRRAWRTTPTGTASIRELTPEDLAAYAGVLREAPVAGIAFSGTGQVSEPQLAREALLAAFERSGGEIVRARVASLSVQRRVTASVDDGPAIDADAAIVCAGAWSGKLMAGLGVRAPLIGERGYSVQSSRHGWPDDLPPTVFEERSMVVSRFVSGLRATSHLEFGAPDAPADARKWRQLQRHLRELGIAFDERPDCWVGPRPTLPDYLPAIGRLRGSPNVFYGFGHQHLGVTLAAATAERLETMVLMDRAPDGADPFRIERFS